MGRSWSSVYGKLVLGVWKELRLTGRGGRRGEKGYSDSREPEWSQKAKEDDEKNGEIGENEEGEVGKRLRRVGHVRQSAGRLHPVGERLRPLTGPTGSRRSESDHHSSFMLPRDCHCTGPSGKRVPRQTLQCLFFTKYCLFGSLFWPSRRKYRISTRDR